MLSSKLPYRLAERAIAEYIATRQTAKTRDLHAAVQRRARRKVGLSTTATTLARMHANGEIDRIAQGLWAPAKPDRSDLARACLVRPVWASVARVFEGKGDPFMRVDDLVARLRLYSPHQVRLELRHMAKAGIVELKPYAHWAGAGKEGRGVGLVKSYWRADQLPPAERAIAEPARDEFEYAAPGDSAMADLPTPEEVGMAYLLS